MNKEQKCKKVIQKFSLSFLRKKKIGNIIILTENFRSKFVFAVVAFSHVVFKQIAAADSALAVFI